MKRECSLEEISDGKLYGLNDMVKADCMDCKGCHACCHDMGKSIVLDPLDVHNLKRGLGKSFEELLQSSIELNVVDGIILPNLKMDELTKNCNFLDSNGRCSIHDIRPGMCRIFPLGRFYENRDFKYFLQIHECKKDIRTKIKVSKWIDVPNIKKNQEFIRKWHYLIKDLAENAGEKLKEIDMYLLAEYFVADFEEEFYEKFGQKIEQTAEKFGVSLH